MSQIIKLNQYENHYRQNIIVNKQSLRLLLRMDRYSHNGTYLIEICFCNSFFSKFKIGSGVRKIEIKYLSVSHP